MRVNDIKFIIDTFEKKHSKFTSFFNADYKIYAKLKSLYQSFPDNDAIKNRLLTDDEKFNVAALLLPYPLTTRMKTGGVVINGVYSGGHSYFYHSSTSHNIHNLLAKHYKNSELLKQLAEYNLLNVESYRSAINYQGMPPKIETLNTLNDYLLFNETSFQKMMESPDADKYAKNLIKNHEALLNNVLSHIQ